MNTDYFSYNKDEKASDRMEDRDPLWLMDEEIESASSNREPTVQWGLIEENNKPSMYTTSLKAVHANTEPLLIPNNGSKDTHKPKKHKQMAYTFPYINNEAAKFDELSKKEKRKSQPTFLFTVGSLQKEEPIPWPATLVTKNQDKQRRSRHHRSNGYNKSGFDEEEEDLIFSMEDDD